MYGRGSDLPKIWGFFLDSMYCIPSYTPVLFLPIHAWVPHDPSGTKAHTVHTLHTLSTYSTYSTVLYILYTTPP
jgi:hypothetical protein